MGFNNAYSAYQKTNVTTASQGHLVVLLYEACIKNLNSALALIEPGNKIKPSNIENFSKLLPLSSRHLVPVPTCPDYDNIDNASDNLAKRLHSAIPARLLFHMFQLNEYNLLPSYYLLFLTYKKDTTLVRARCGALFISCVNFCFTYLRGMYVKLRHPVALL